jgi:hypothetical protein
MKSSKEKLPLSSWTYPDLPPFRVGMARCAVRAAFSGAMEYPNRLGQIIVPPAVRGRMCPMVLAACRASAAGVSLECAQLPPDHPPLARALSAQVQRQFPRAIWRGVVRILLLFEPLSSVISKLHHPNQLRRRRRFRKMLLHPRHRVRRRQPVLLPQIIHRARVLDESVRPAHPDHRRRHLLFAQ